MNRRTFLASLVAAAGLGMAKATGLRMTMPLPCTNYAGQWHRCAVLGNCPAEGQLVSTRAVSPELFEKAWAVDMDDLVRLQHTRNEMLRFSLGEFWVRA